MTPSNLGCPPVGACMTAEKRRIGCKCLKMSSADMQCIAEITIRLLAVTLYYLSHRFYL